MSHGHFGVSNHQQLHCLVNRVYKRTSKKMSKLRATGLCEENPPLTGEFLPTKGQYREKFHLMHLELFGADHLRITSLPEESIYAKFWSCQTWSCGSISQLCHSAQALIQYKVYYQERKSHCGDKTVIRSSYLNNGISYSGKITSSYWFPPVSWYTHCISNGQRFDQWTKATR